MREYQFISIKSVYQKPMRKIIKQTLGIDVAQQELVVCFGRMYDDWTPELMAYKTFRNTEKGFATLVQWVLKIADPMTAVQFVMEATGVYHEKLAYYLDENGFSVSIVLPTKISNYARTLTIKTITDKTASAVIAQFGLERKLERWKRPNNLFKKLRQLTREREQLVTQRTALANQLHAEQAEAEPNEQSIKRTQRRLALLNEQEKEIKAELSKLIDADQNVNQMVTRICTLPGVGRLTAMAVLGETNGFELIRNKRQLTSFAGLDIKEKQSGTSVKGKPQLSKKGNRFLRKSMHMPALTAIRHDERMKSVFARLIARHGIKMKAVVAVQRKLLELMYTIWKNGQNYDPKYLQLGIEMN